jgi:transposase
VAILDGGISDALEGMMESANRGEVGIVKHATKRWSIEEKKRIVGETLATGTSVAKVAQKHGVHVSQVYQWRKQYGKEKQRSKRQSAAKLLPVMVTAELGDKGGARRLPVGTVEIELAKGRIRIVGADAPLLRAALEMLR